MRSAAATPLDVHGLRAAFPGLQREVAGRPAVFLDGPAGSQVPQPVADAMLRYLLHDNANRGGAFVTSATTDAMVDAACTALADLLGAGDPAEIVFGANMTTLTFALGRSLAKTWRPGDRILVTDADHDANVTPWVLAAADAGAEVQRVGVLADGTIDAAALERLLTPRTRLCAFGAASNLLGTVQPVAELAARCRTNGTLSYVDAVHYAPHRLPDVAAWGCDFAVCSAYKFFGPHVGVLWGRGTLLRELPAYRVRPAGDDLPGRWMTGTPNLEGIAGTLAAVVYLASLAERQKSAATTRRAALRSAFARIEAHERSLGERLLRGVAAIPGLRVVGVADPTEHARRVATFALRSDRHRPQELHRALAEQGIFSWAGNSYAVPLSTALGLEPDGVLRLGLLHYNTADEVDRVVAALAALHR